MLRRSRILLVAITLAALTASSGLSGGQTAVPVARAATTVELCGRVTAYVKPSALLVGAITVGAVPFVIAAGTSVSSDVQVGANVCLRLTLNAGGTITNLVVVQAGGGATLKLCAVVKAFVAATATRTGRLEIGAHDLVVAVGADLPAKVKVGADLCVTLELNVFGQVKDGTAEANAASTLRICGVVSAFAAASPTQNGNLTIAGHKFTVAQGADLPASVKAGANLCLTLELNAFGQVQDCAATANVTSRLRLCGDVSAFAEATASKTGNMTIAGRSLTLALGSNLPAQFRAGADLCATLELNAFGQVQDGQAVANVTTNATVCGQVTAYEAASGTSNGSMTIGGTSKTIAAGTNVSSTVKGGAYLRLRLSVDAFGRIADVTVLRVGTSVSDACSDGAPTPSPSPDPRPSPSPDANPDPSPTPGPSPSPTTNPDPGASPTPDPATSPTPTSEPGASPTPDPAPGTTPAPEPGASSSPEPGASPTPTPPPGLPGVPAVPGSPGGPDAPGVPGGEVCPPVGSGTAAPALSADASPVERAGSLMASAALPFALFAMGMLAAGLVSKVRRERGSEDEDGWDENDEIDGDEQP